MKQVFGVEWFNKQEDFDEAIAKVTALLKDGDESTIVYIANESEKCHEVLAKGMFVPQRGTSKLYPTIVFNETLLNLLHIDWIQERQTNKLIA